MRDENKARQAKRALQNALDMVRFGTHRVQVGVAAAAVGLALEGHLYTTNHEKDVLSKASVGLKKALVRGEVEGVTDGPRWKRIESMLIMMLTK